MVTLGWAFKSLAAVAVGGRERGALCLGGLGASLFGSLGPWNVGRGHWGWGFPNLSCFIVLVFIMSCFIAYLFYVACLLKYCLIAPALSIVIQLEPLSLFESFDHFCLLNVLTIIEPGYLFSAEEGSDESKVLC